MTAPFPTRPDVLVVGAGPAGSSAARSAARAGARTLVVERKREIGRPVRCGELVPRMFLTEVGRMSHAVVQHTERLVLHLPGGSVRALRAPGAVLDRERFDRALVERAEEAGAEVRVSTRVVGMEDGAVLDRDGEIARVRPRRVVGADGPRSRVAACAGLGAPGLMLAVQRVVGLARPVDDAHLYFWPTARWGYGWLFPKDDRANVGAAVPWRRNDLARRALSELLGRLAAEGTVRNGAVLSRCTGLVPVSGPLPRTVGDDVLLAGDAAGHVDALTGAGIVSAVRAGELAGRAAASERPDDYERAWRRLMGGYLARSTARRDALEGSWDRDVDGAVKDAWLGGRDGRRQ